MVGLQLGTGITTESISNRTGDQLITNGDFASDISGWDTVPGLGTVAFDTGALKISQSAGESKYLKAYQAITTIPGQTYKYSVYLVDSSNKTTHHSIEIGSTEPGDKDTDYEGDLASYNFLANATPPEQIHAGSFTAAGTTTYVCLQNASSQSYTATFDNVSVR